MSLSLEELHEQFVSLKTVVDGRSQKTLDKLAEKVENIEKERQHFKVGGMVISMVLAILGGYTISAIPGAATKAAKETLPPLVKAQADDLLPKMVEEAANDRLPGLVNSIAKNELPRLVKNSADALVPRLQEDVAQKLTTILDERSADVSRVRDSMLNQYADVIADAATAKKALKDVQELAETIKPDADKLGDQVNSLKVKANELEVLLEGIGKSNAAEIARVEEEPRNSPGAQTLLKEFPVLRRRC